MSDNPFNKKSNSKYSNNTTVLAIYAGTAPNDVADENPEDGGMQCIVKNVLGRQEDNAFLPLIGTEVTVRMSKAGIKAWAGEKKTRKRNIPHDLSVKEGKRYCVPNRGLYILSDAIVKEDGLVECSRLKLLAKLPEGDGNEFLNIFPIAYLNVQKLKNKDDLASVKIIASHDDLYGTVMPQEEDFNTDAWVKSLCEVLESAQYNKLHLLLSGKDDDGNMQTVVKYANFDYEKETKTDGFKNIINSPDFAHAEFATPIIEVITGSFSLNDGVSIEDGNIWEWFQVPYGDGDKTYQGFIAVHACFLSVVDKNDNDKFYHNLKAAPIGSANDLEKFQTRLKSIREIGKNICSSSQEKAEDSDGDETEGHEPEYDDDEVAF